MRREQRLGSLLLPVGRDALSDGQGALPDLAKGVGPLGLCVDEDDLGVAGAGVRGRKEEREEVDRWDLDVFVR